MHGEPCLMNETQQGCIFGRCGHGSFIPVKTLRYGPGFSWELNLSVSADHTVEHGRGESEDRPAAPGSRARLHLGAAGRTRGSARSPRKVH